MDGLYVHERAIQAPDWCYYPYSWEFVPGMFALQLSVQVPVLFMFEVCYGNQLFSLEHFFFLSFFLMTPSVIARWCSGWGQGVECYANESFMVLQLLMWEICERSGESPACEGSLFDKYLYINANIYSSQTLRKVFLGNQKKKCDWFEISY